MFASAHSAKLQEIGPRFTLKLRWLRKGLPAVTAGDGSIPRGGGSEDVDEVEMSKQEKKDEDEAMAEMSVGQGRKTTFQEMGIPALDEEQEYEWKWKVRLGKTPPFDADVAYSPKWRSRGGHSSYDAMRDASVLIALGES